MSYLGIFFVGDVPLNDKINPIATDLIVTLAEVKGSPERENMWNSGKLQFNFFKHYINVIMSHLIIAALTLPLLTPPPPPPPPHTHTLHPLYLGMFENVIIQDNVWFASWNIVARCAMAIITGSHTCQAIFPAAAQFCATCILGCCFAAAEDNVVDKFWCCSNICLHWNKDTVFCFPPPLRRIETCEVQGGPLAHLQVHP